MKIQVTNKYPIPGNYHLIRPLVKRMVTMGAGDSFKINYMLWSKISGKVRAIIAYHNIKITTRRMKGKDIKNTRVYCISNPNKVKLL